MPFFVTVEVPVVTPEIRSPVCALSGVYTDAISPAPVPVPFFAVHVSAALFCHEVGLPVTVIVGSPAPVADFII